MIMSQKVKKRFIRRPPPTEEEIQVLRKSAKRNTSRITKADAIAWQAMAEVWPEEDE